MISRAIVHIDGSPGAGRPPSFERLLSALDKWVVAVRAAATTRSREPRESSSARDPEVRRYHAAGASDAGRFAFPSDRDAAGDFFANRLLTDVSDIAVLVVAAAAPGCAAAGRHRAVRAADQPPQTGAA
jgi:hypothetical protein